MIPLNEVPDYIEQLCGDRPGLSSVYRWAQRGLAGVRLRTQRIAGKRRTKPEWLDEFFDATACTEPLVTLAPDNGYDADFDECVSLLSA